eukprot:jgi/Mesvir1/24951/Mv16924-RA.2
MCDHFEVLVADTNCFCHMPPGDLASVLMRDDLALLRPESAVLSVVTQYLLANPACTLDDELALLGCVRYPLVDTLELIQVGVRLRSLGGSAAMPALSPPPSLHGCVEDLTAPCGGVSAWQRGATAVGFPGNTEEPAAAGAAGVCAVDDPHCVATSTMQPSNGEVAPCGWAGIMLHTVTDVLRQRGVACWDACIPLMTRTAPLAMGPAPATTAPFELPMSTLAQQVGQTPMPDAVTMPVAAGAIEHVSEWDSSVNSCSDNTACAHVACASTTPGQQRDAGDASRERATSAPPANGCLAGDVAGIQPAELASGGAGSSLASGTGGGHAMTSFLHLQPYHFSARRPRQRGTLRLTVDVWGAAREVASSTYLLGGCSWQLVAYPRGHASAAGKYVSLFLRCVSTSHASKSHASTSHASPRCAGPCQPCCAPSPHDICRRGRRSSWEGPTRAGWAAHASVPSSSFPVGMSGPDPSPSPAMLASAPAALRHDACCRCGVAGGSNNSLGLLGSPPMVARHDMRYGRHVRYAFTIMALPASQQLPPLQSSLASEGLCPAPSSSMVYSTDQAGAPSQAEADKGPCLIPGGSMGPLMPVLRQEDHAWFIPTLADEWGFRNFVPLCDVPKYAIRGRLLVDVDVFVETT